MESLERESCHGELSPADATVGGAYLLDQFTPRTSKGCVGLITSHCTSAIRPEKHAGVSPVNLPFSFNIPIKIEDAPAEDREAARALVCLGERGAKTPSRQTLGQKRGFGELSVNTSFGGVVTNAPLKKRRAVAAAWKISVKMYGGVSDKRPTVGINEIPIVLATPSFQRTLSVLADTATELCCESFFHHDSSKVQGAVCIELLQNF